MAIASESEPLARRCQRAADAAIPGARGNVRVRRRAPLQVEIEDVPGQPPLTAPQRTAARVAAEAVNSAVRMPRPVQDIAADIAAWVGVDIVRLRRVAALALAVAVSRDPTFAQRHGVPVDGD